MRKWIKEYDYTDITQFFSHLFHFSSYLGRSFSAIPYAYGMFTAHKQLCAACFVGLLCNLTRSKAVHAAWCCVMFYALTQTEIDW